MNQHTQLARFGLFDARVPRYTSYPTAPQFAGGVGPDVFADWIEAIPEGASISLYLHVPFCRRLCWFCACRTQGTTSDAPVIAYVETLKSELALLRALLPRGVTLSRLHWGGGTPTLLSADLMRALAEAIFAASRHIGGPSAQVIGIPTSEYPTPAKRPLNSRLASTMAFRKFGLRLPDWKAGLAKSVAVLVPELAAQAKG